MMHPSSRYAPEQLLEELMIRKEQGRVTCKRDGDLGLFCYTRDTQYQNLWDEFTEMARGLVFDMAEKKIISRPFSKFYNHNERDSEAPVPVGKFRAFEKCDGSMIPAFQYRGEWRTTTKNSFRAPQALWASEQLKRLPTHVLEPCTTYIFEAVYQQNRVVVKYAYEGLVLLGAYAGDGRELMWEEIEETAQTLGVRTPTAYDFSSFDEIVATAKDLNVNSEGFVVCFDGGFRLKVKGEAYLRAHRSISHVTPLTLWEMMWKQEDFEPMRKEIPEEFQVDFDLIRQLLQQQFDDYVAMLCAEKKKLDHLTNKEIGLALKSFSKDIQTFVFEIRRNETGWMNHGKTRKTLFDRIRPTDNRLPGYTPGIAMQRVIFE